MKTKKIFHAKMNCFGRIFNLTIFVCNFLFFLTGCAILGLGAYIQANIEYFGDFMIDYNVDSGIILMVLGGIILAISFLGCCGACTGKLGDHIYTTPGIYSEH